MPKLSFSPPVTDLQQAIVMAGCCYQAYNFMIGPDMVLPPGYRHLYSFYAPFREYFASIIEAADSDSNGSYILLFRGTETSIMHPIDIERDIHNDIDLVQCPYTSGDANAKVHSGFSGLYDSLRTFHLLKKGQSIIDIVKTLDPQRTLYITGHSLGGALATLAAMDIAEHAPVENLKVYTFASPRVGNASFVALYNKLVPHTVRIANTNDYVPLEPQVQIPFADPLYYYHVKGKMSLNFNTQSLEHNHSIVHYFHALAKKDPTYYQELLRSSPHFCPPKDPPSAQRENSHEQPLAPRPAKSAAPQKSGQSSAQRPALPAQRLAARAQSSRKPTIFVKALRLPNRRHVNRRKGR